MEQYLIHSERLNDDGTIGIPADVSVYHKTGKTDLNTPVVFYVRGYVGEHEIATEPDEPILADLIDDGFIVILLDYLGNERAVAERVTWSVQHLRIPDRLTSFMTLPYAKMKVYALPAGYRMAHDILFYELDKDAYLGVKERILESFNNPEGAFRTKRGAMVPKGHDHADSVYECVKPDGTPIDLTLKLDIMYPSKPKKEVPLVMVASSSGVRTGIVSAYSKKTTERPLDIGPMLRGNAVCIYDHSYIPMARSDHYGYYNPYSVAGLTGIDVHRTAVRCARYYAEDFGYSRDRVAVMGHSKAAQCANLSHPHPELLAESTNVDPACKGDVSKQYRYEGNGRYLNYRNGTPIASSVTVAYHSMGDGSYRYAQYLTPENAPTFIACGKFDDEGKPVGPVYWDAEKAAYEQSGIDYFACFMEDLGHSYPVGIDYRFGYDRFDAFMKFLSYYLEGDRVPEPIYTCACGGLQMADSLFVQYLAPVKKDSVCITLSDSDGKQVPGHVEANKCGNLYTFVPDKELPFDGEYTMTVKDGAVSVMNGKTARGVTVTFKAGNHFVPVDEKIPQLGK